MLDKRRRAKYKWFGWGLGHFTLIEGCNPFRSGIKLTRISCFVITFCWNRIISKQPRKISCFKTCVRASMQKLVQWATFWILSCHSFLVISSIPGCHCLICTVNAIKHYNIVSCFLLLCCYFNFFWYTESGVLLPHIVETKNMYVV